MKPIFVLAEEMLRQWAVIVGIDPNKTSFDSLEHSLYKKYSEALNSLQMDPTGISTVMLAKAFFDSFTGRQIFTLADVMHGSDELNRQIKAISPLSGLIADPSVKDSLDDFRAGIQSALTHYEVEISDRVKNIIDDNDSLSSLRLSAFTSGENLRLNQFLRGDRDTTSKPAYMKTIYKWWNINSLLAAAVSMPSGVSLHLISAPKVFNSYFVFLIKNGGNLYILSDVEAIAHPYQEEMRRRPDRQFQDRVNQNWFPYELENVVFDEEEGEFNLSASKTNDLVAYQAQNRPLAKLGDIEPESSIWLIMMFTLIVKRFWGDDVQAKELSYTGEMIVKSQALIDRAESSNLPVAPGQAFKPVRIDEASIKPGVASRDEIGKSYDLTHGWLEERYGHMVGEDVLNNTVEGALVKKTAEGKMVVASPDDDSKTELSISTHAYRLTRFGTATEIENDRKFIARANYADAISALAKKEFLQRKDEIVAWFDAKARANIENLIAYAGNESIWIHDGEKIGLEDSIRKNLSTSRNTKKDQFHEFMRTVEFGQHGSLYGARILYSKSGSGGSCNITGAKPSYIVGFTPATSAEIAVIAGCTVTDLPDVLQNFSLRKTRTGNQILDRIDPMAWRVKSPWEDLDFRVILAFSKRGMTQAKKLAKLPCLAIAREEDMEGANYCTIISGWA